MLKYEYPKGNIWKEGGKMNINELKGEIAKNGLSIPKVADLLGMSRKTLYSRVEGTTPFTQREISALAKLLNLDSTKMMVIFLTI